MKVDCRCLKHKLPALAVCFLLFAGRASSQTGIRVTYYDGTEQGYSIAASGKLYFGNDNLLIAVNDAATPTSIPVSAIRRLTFPSAAPLPVRLVDFTLRNEKAQVTLAWKTENEINASYFGIERTADGANYQSIGQVAASNSATGGNYSFVDGAPKTGIGYYRLKQVDADGKYVYSKTLTVNRSASANIILLPNPATDHITIYSSSAERLNVKIYSVTGQLLIWRTYAPGEQINTGKLTAGLYVAVVNDKPYRFIKE